MSQHDYNIANGGGAAVRADINLALAAVLSQNSGATAPTTTRPFMPWYDTTTGALKFRNAADTAWVSAIEAIGGSQGVGFRNKLINGAFEINQRAYVSGSATTAGQYTLDRWKVTGTGGITFSTTANKTTVTIPAGQTLQQVIEGLNLETSTYVLSWEGTAQGRIGGGSYGASGTVTASITGGTNITVEFNTGTLANVQIEAGSAASPFERNEYGTDLAMCQRYYENGVVYGVSYGSSATFLQRCQITYLVQKRAIPTVTVALSTGSLTSPSAVDVNLNAAWIGFASTAAGLEGKFSYTASSEL
jgi:hypothetical protein